MHLVSDSGDWQYRAGSCTPSNATLLSPGPSKHCDKDQSKNSDPTVRVQESSFHQCMQSSWAHQLVILFCMACIEHLLLSIKCAENGLLMCVPRFMSLIFFVSKLTWSVIFGPGICVIALMYMSSWCAMSCGMNHSSRQTHGSWYTLILPSSTPGCQTHSWEYHKNQKPFRGICKTSIFFRKHDKHVVSCMRCRFSSHQLTK